LRLCVFALQIEGRGAQKDIRFAKEGIVLAL
jgi:hypothetical protein